jgi:hypothetical protein
MPTVPYTLTMCHLCFSSGSLFQLWNCASCHVLDTLTFMACWHATHCLPGMVLRAYICNMVSQAMQYENVCIETINHSAHLMRVLPLLFNRPTETLDGGWLRVYVVSLLYINCTYLHMWQLCVWTYGIWRTKITLFTVLMYFRTQEGRSSWLMMVWQKLFLIEFLQDFSISVIE